MNRIKTALFCSVAVVAVACSGGLPKFGADLGKQSTPMGDVRPPYMSTISYYGYVAPGGQPNNGLAGDSSPGDFANAPSSYCDGKTVHVVGIPLHWGFTGAARKGFGPNSLTPFVGDANIQTPEFKAFLVNVEPTTPPEGIRTTRRRSKSEVLGPRSNSVRPVERDTIRATFHAHHSGRSGAE